MIHERPGVYSSYDASSVVSASAAAKTIGAAAVAAKGEANKVALITSYEEGESVFGEDTSGVYGMSTLLKFLFANGAGAVKAVAVGKKEGANADYESAFGYKLSYTTDDVGGDGQFGRIGGMILRAGNGADAGYYGAVWDEARLVDVSRMITEEEWKLNKSGKNKKIANGGDVLSNEKYEKPGNEKILEEKTSQRKSENIEEQEILEQSKNTDAVRKSKSNPNVPEERNSQNANSDLPPKTTKDIIYKITRQEIAGLPRKEWKLANNHFLLHGYYNYHHLVSFEKEGKCWIGVPGLYFPGEQRAAGAFGFSQFMKPSDGELDLEEYEIEDEEHFGYWCRPVGAVIRKEVKEKEDAADIDRRRKIHEGSDPSGEKSMED